MANNKYNDIVMFIEINNFLDLNSDGKQKGEFFGISESSTDGSFLVHHFLSLNVRNSIPVCFIALKQSFGHYNAISQKFGTNLLPHKDSEKLFFFEGLKSIGPMCFNSCEKGDNTTNLVDTKSLLANILQTIKTKYTELSLQHVVSPTIIIDDISILLSLGCSMKDLMTFCQYLYELVLSIPNNFGNLVLYTNNGKFDDDEQLKTLWNWVCHNATMTIEIAGLTTGYCKEVHGQISAQKRDNVLKPSKTKTMQYKLTDKNILMFAAGMSSAVL